MIQRAAALGVGAIYVRDHVGGSGLTRFDAALIFEALATGCPAVVKRRSLASTSAMNTAPPSYATGTPSGTLWAW